MPEGTLARDPYLALLPVGLAMPPLLPAARWALTPPFHPYPSRKKGGLFSVALSVGLPRPGITRHRFLLESGLSSPSPESDKAAIQPSAQGTDYRGKPHSVKSRAQHALKVYNPVHTRVLLH